jgi:hypothetical protein
LVLPWRLKNYLTGYFDAGGRETLYDTSGHDLLVIPVGTSSQQQNNNSLALDGLTLGGFDHREMVYGGGGISTVLEKIYDLQVFSLRHFKHTIEPMVDYSYVPRVEQRELPVFDEVDRVNARSLVTYGLVSRLFAKSGSVAERPAEKPEEAMSPENLEVTPAPNYRASGASFELARFTLLEAYDTAHSVTKQGSRLTDIDAGLTLFPTSVLALTSMAGFDPHAKQLDQASVVMSLRSPWRSSSSSSNRGRALQGGPFLQVSYTFIGGREAVQQITGRMYYEFFDRFGLYYEPSYSLADRRLLYSEYGIRVKSKCDCWIIDIGVTDKVNPREVQTLFQVTLGGIGSAGRNPFGRNPFTQPPSYY